MPETQKMPAPEPNGFVKTLNKMGYMTSSLDPFSQKFVDFASGTPAPVLDVGAAYGVASLEALARGAKVIANDIEKAHLEILKNRVSREKQDRLKLLPGAFPDLEICEDSLGAVLICRVLHFFDGEKIEKSARQVFRWLRKGGRLFVIGETPYLGNFKKFIPTYEERVKKGVKWPGYIENVVEIAPDRGASLPKKMLMLDPHVLERTFLEAGFKVLECRTFPRKDFPEDVQLDGRESVGMIAEKD